MIGQKVRYERINEKLAKYGLYLSFGSVDSKGHYWLPSIQVNNDNHFEYSVYSLYGVYIDVITVGVNRVKFYVKDLRGIDVSKQSGDWFKLYKNWINEIDKLIDYCNNLELRAPKYVDGGYQNWCE